MSKRKGTASAIDPCKELSFRAGTSCVKSEPTMAIFQIVASRARANEVDAARSWLTSQLIRATRGPKECQPGREIACDNNTIVLLIRS
jgi:hypothetical protein